MDTEQPSASDVCRPAAREFKGFRVTVVVTDAETNGTVKPTGGRVAGLLLPIFIVP
ncbi:MAG: hypothetical protein O3C10_04990 [Chloroflexi bacterium]|nr:hypothetical protein [Chloroflexota bacterium]